MIFLIHKLSFSYSHFTILEAKYTRSIPCSLLPKIWYSRIILHKRSLHVTRERNESCFSPSTASDSYFLHRRWSCYCNILHLGLSGGYLALQGNLICLYPTGGYLGGHHSLFFYRFCRRLFLSFQVLLPPLQVSLYMVTSSGPFTTISVLSLVVPLSFTWFVSTEHPLFSPWSASAPMTSISVGWMRAIALTDFLSL